MAAKMNLHIEKVMQSMGWTDDSFIPFASDENKGLMDALQQLLRRKSDKSALNEQINERVKWLKEHFSNAHADVNQNLVGDFRRKWSARNDFISLFFRN